MCNYKKEGLVNELKNVPWGVAYNTFDDIDDIPTLLAKVLYRSM